MAGPGDDVEERLRRVFTSAAPGKLVGHGHPVGDFLEAFDWDVLEARDGLLRVRAHLPDHVRNPRGQLFGGFTPTYVDYIALHTFWAGRDPTPGHPWLATTSLRVDYLAPIVADRFEIEARVLHRRSSTCFIEVRFLSPRGAEGIGAGGGAEEEEGDLLALAHATMRVVHGAGDSAGRPPR